MRFATTASMRALRSGTRNSGRRALWPRPRSAAPPRGHFSALGFAEPAALPGAPRRRLGEEHAPDRVEQRVSPSPVTAETRCTSIGFFRRAKRFSSFSPAARASGTSIFVTATICGFFASSGE